MKFEFRVEIFRPPSELKSPQGGRDWPPPFYCLAGTEARPFRDLDLIFKGQVEKSDISEISETSDTVFCPKCPIFRICRCRNSKNRTPRKSRKRRTCNFRDFRGVRSVRFFAWQKKSFKNRTIRTHRTPRTTNFRDFRGVRRVRIFVYRHLQFRKIGRLGKKFNLLKPMLLKEKLGHHHENYGFLRKKQNTFQQTPFTDA